MEGLLGLRLLSKTGLVDLAAFTKQEFRLIYFSAGWCPPCRGFTPLLRDFYQKVNSPAKKVEVVFVSRDENEASFEAYYKEMPWLAVDFKEQARIKALLTRFQVKTIPTLVLVHADGSEAHRDCRNEVVQKGVAALAGWQEKLKTVK
jgi:nucleoredoxin